MQPTDRFEVLGIWEESKFSPNARAAMPEIGPLLETYDNSKVADDVRLPELPKGRAFYELCFEGVPTDISIGPEQTLAAQFSVGDFFLVIVDDKGTSFYEPEDPPDHDSFVARMLTEPAYIAAMARCDFLLLDQAGKLVERVDVSSRFHIKPTPDDEIGKFGPTFPSVSKVQAGGETAKIHLASGDFVLATLTVQNGLIGHLRRATNRLLDKAGRSSNAKTRGTTTTTILSENRNQHLRVVHGA